MGDIESADDQEDEVNRDKTGYMKIPGMYQTSIKESI